MVFRSILLIVLAVFSGYSTFAQDASPKLSFSICNSSYEPDSGWQRVQVCMYASDSNSYHSRGQVYLEFEGGSLAVSPKTRLLFATLSCSTSR
ncbi:MAG: hypothetical protein R3B47_00355 [Bacteroidia bacterium]